MSPQDLFRAVQRAFLAHRVRAVLTLLGVMIGSGSIVLLSGLLHGGRAALLRTSQGVTGAPLLEVVNDEPPLAQRQKTTRPLTVEDAQALGDPSRLGAVAVGGVMERQTRAHLGGQQKRVTLVGGGPDARALYRLELRQGRFLDGQDLDSRARVCVVGHEVYEELLAKPDAPAEPRLVIEGVSWRVVGVLAKKPSMGKGNGTYVWDRKVLVPRTTYEAALEPSGALSRLFVQLQEEGGEGSAAVDARRAAAKPPVRETLLSRHYGVKNFLFVDEREGAGQETAILMVIQVLLLGTGLLSLGVGGINIMNIMLVTVTERRREIGVRRAVGASRRSIVQQFVAESAAVGLAGGGAGVLGGLVVSWLASWALAHLFGAWPFHVEPWAIVAGLGLALGVGVTFGLAPALKAARIDPVEALRGG